MIARRAVLAGLRRCRCWAAASRARNHRRLQRRGCAARPPAARAPRSWPAPAIARPRATCSSPAAAWRAWRRRGRCASAASKTSRCWNSKTRPAATAAAARSAASPARWARTTCRCRATTRREVQDLLEELGLRRRVAGRWVYDERHLCHAPQERLFFHGEWQEGLLPRAGRRRRRRWRSTGASRSAVDAGAAARRASRIPACARRPAGHRALDAITFAAWLDREGLTDPHLRWYLDYCCRDDYGAGIGTVSAWAGLHYFASRHGFQAPGATSRASARRVLTWPEGNGWLTPRAGRAAGRPLARGPRRAAHRRAAGMASRWTRGTPPRKRVERWQADALHRRAAAVHRGARGARTRRRCCASAARRTALRALGWSPTCTCASR